MAEVYKRKNLIDNLKRIFMIPCAENGLAYVELATEALVRFGIDVAIPDFKEAYHKTFGEPVVHTIRQTLKDIAEGTALEDGPLLRAVGSGLGLYDQATWWIFLLSALDQQLYDSTSNFIKMDPCLSGPGNGSGTAWISAVDDRGNPGQVDFQFKQGSKYYPVSPSGVAINESNRWAGSIACSVEMGKLVGPPSGVHQSLEFHPDDGGPALVLDHFSNDDGTGQPTQLFNHAFFHYQGSAGRNGSLRCLFSYTGPPLPSHECFLRPNSFCFMNG